LNRYWEISSHILERRSSTTRIQRPNEKQLAKRVPHLPDKILHWIILQGLRPWIKASINAQKGDLKTIAHILECAKVAESGGLGKEDITKLNQLVQEVCASREKVQQLSTKMAKMSVATVQPRSLTPERREQRVSFQQDAQLSQRDRAAGYISFGQKWNTGTGRQYFTDIIGLSSTTVI